MFVAVDAEGQESSEDGIGTSEADTVPNSPYSSPSRLTTIINLANVMVRSIKIPYSISSSESE